ncbi:MAG: hypothetical protein KAW40_05350 [Candidatus Aenigmarchaeota archaeon]|nr:hypothetical protein [Candidatus Aenigmarchaeota archaeon]
MANEFIYAWLDIRNFFVTCEQYSNPEYRGKPVVVYNECEKEQHDGSIKKYQKIISMSKEAKERHGISRESYMDDAKRISDVILIKSSKSKREEYEKIADQVYEKCRDYVENEGYSISKPYIDDIFMKLPKDLDVAINITSEVKKLYKEFGFDLATGISFNKDYAHIAAKWSKLYGLTYFGRGFAKRVIYKRKVKEFPGIGSKSKEKLNRADIHTIGDFANTPLDFIINTLRGTLPEGKVMKIYYSILDIEPNNDQLELFENK